MSYEILAIELRKPVEPDEVFSPRKIQAREPCPSWEELLRSLVGSPDNWLQVMHSRKGVAATSDWLVVVDPEAVSHKKETLCRLSERTSGVVFAVWSETYSKTILIFVARAGQMIRSAIVQRGKILEDKGTKLPGEPTAISDIDEYGIARIVRGLGLDMEAVKERGSYQTIEVA